MQVAQKVVAVGSIATDKAKKIVQKYKKVQIPSEDKTNNMNAVELFSLVLGLGHTLGLLNLTNKTRYMMLMLNLVIIMGHFQEMRRYISRNLSHL